MKSLYPKAKGKIHPSPSCPGGGGAGDAMAVLSLLPAAILVLTAALKAEDREVLAYMVTRSLQGAWSLAAEEKRRCWRLGSHQPLFSCGCFDCYTSYWFRWDSSPDRELIHQAIEAFEEHLASSEKRRQQTAGKGGRRRDRRSDKAKAEPEEKGKGKRKAGKEKKKAASGGGAGAGGEGPSTVMVPYVEEEAEKIYHAELVLADEVRGGADGAGSEGEKEDGGTGLELVAMSPSQQQQQGGERKRGWVDVIGLFNSRFWSLWNPAV